MSKIDDEKPSSTQNQPTPPATINTGGGAFVDGDAHVGADLIGRDKITGESIIIHHHYGAASSEAPYSLPLADVPCPYRGLEFFDVPHAANYFGRSEMTQKLLVKVQEGNFIAVVGPSGSGKSSLVRAGLMVALQQGALTGSRDWRLEIFRPGENPLLALAGMLLQLDTSLSKVERWNESEKLVNRLRNGELSIDYVLDQLRGSLPKLLLIVDQFEETFTLCSDEKLRATFLATLLAAAEKSWLTVIVTLRADFFGRVLEDEHFGKRVDAGLVNVLAMNETERCAAIEQPALNAGRRFEEGLVQRILDAVAAAPGELPLLEFALTELWEKQTPDGLLTHAAYEAIGELTGALARRADNTLKAFKPADQAALRRVFTRLVRVAQPDEGAEDTKRRIGLDELDTTVQPLVRKLADARLLVTGRDAKTGEETVEVAHEALIRNWHELKGWLNGDREFLLWRQRLRTMVANWQASGRDAGALLRGALLAEGRAWLQTRTTDLSEQERSFIAASQTAAEQEAQEREAARQRELEQQRALVREAEARRKAEAERAQVEAAAAKSLRQRAWYLALALLVALGALLATGLTLREVQRQRKRAEDNTTLANQKLAELAGAQLLQAALDLKKSGKFQEALAKFDEAYKAPVHPDFDIKAEKEDVLRQNAIQLVQEGEKLASNHDLDGAAAKYQAALALKPPLDTPVYVRVPAGEFTMGSDPTADKYAKENEKRQYTVLLREFWLQRTEVTNAQYAQCIQANACTPPDNTHWNNPKLGNWPVTDVTWHQANIYAKWRGGRLPTEAEWEKACRGTDARIYPWGNQPPTPELANFGYKEGAWTNVGNYPQGTSPYGLFDMAGNVSEWTSSLWGESYDKPDFGYPYDAKDGRESQTEPNSVFRALRGGSFNVDDVIFDGGVRCAVRYRAQPDKGNYSVGIRVVSPGD